MIFAFFLNLIVDTKVVSYQLVYDYSPVGVVGCCCLAVEGAMMFLIVNTVEICVAWFTYYCQEREKMGRLRNPLKENNEI